jgi:predicted transcriptional regulator
MDPLLSQPTRRRIFDVVSAHPGASARDIQRRAQLGWGETAYHLDQLTRAGVLRRERGRGRDYYFPASMTWEDRRLLQALRSPAQRRLLLVLSETPNLTLLELHQRLGISLSTASFHLRQLLSAALVEGHRSGNVRRYRPVHPQRVAELVRGYHASFEDSLVDRFVDTWSGLFGR